MPTAIRRTFVDLGDKDLEEAEALASLRWAGLGSGIDWNAVLQSRLVVLLAEAQSGKTYECQTRQEAMWAAGEAAFFVDLSSLAQQPWQSLRSPEEDERLDRWRRTEAEVATIFLDSLDELRLTQGNFRTALRSVAKDLYGHMGRVRVVLTSRPLPVDRDLFLKTFAAPAGERPLTADDFARLAMGEHKETAEEAPAPVRTVTLLPLDLTDIKTLAEDRGVTDTCAFLEGLRAASMLPFMRRPQDVIEAASAWQALGNRFGTHAEQVSFDIRARLKPNPGRPDRQLEDYRALGGAKRLALAVVLTRRLTIRHDVNNDVGNASEVLDPSVILGDWRDDERKALLERGLFGFATYGRVRFHNRLAFEFLAAERLSDLLTAGASRTAIRRLLVIQTAQGTEVLRPSLRDVAAWLALRHNWVFDLVSRLDPALLMELGDPASLTVDQRQRLLRSYVERFGKGGWRGLTVPAIQLHRIADPSLEEIVRAEFPLVENSEIRQVLLDLIGTARFRGCADLARGVLWQPHAEHHERLDALDALVGLDHPALTDVATALAAEVGPWDQRFARIAVYRLFPRYMSIDQLLQALGWLKETRSTGWELSRNLPPLIADLSITQLDQLRAGLTALIKTGLRFDSDTHAVRSDRPHLVHMLAAACARLLMAGALLPEHTEAVALAAELARGIRSDEDFPGTLRDAIDAASGPLREAIFKADVALLRKLRPDQPRLDLMMNLVWQGTLRLVPDDEPWMRDLLAAPSTLPDVRAAALLMVTFQFARSADRGDADLANLKPLIVDDPELLAYLERKLRPDVPSRQERRMAICTQRRKRQRERRYAKDKASWVSFWRELSENPDAAFAAERADNTARNLWRVMRRGGARSRSAGWDRMLIERHLGSGVADRLRSAMLPIWRRNPPPLDSERPPEERNQLFDSWILSLAAISAEAENPSWAECLTEADAEAALRYVAWNGSEYPAWLEDLAVAHPAIVTRVLGGELESFLSEPVPQQGHSIMLQCILYAPDAVATLLVPRIRSWLRDTKGVPSAGDDLDGFPQRLEQIIAILLKFGDPSDGAAIAATASSRLAEDADDATAKVLLPILFQLDPEAAVARLEAICASVPVDRNSAAVGWFARLFGGLHRGRGVSTSYRGMSPSLILRLLRLAYQHVERTTDAQHEGSYSPDMRDDAETGRSMLLNALIDLDGPEGWSIKQEIARDPVFAHFRDRLHRLAVEHSAREADERAMAPEEVIKLDESEEPAPRSPSEMFALMKDRLSDLRDHLLEDASPRELWSAVTEERVMRKAIAGYLKNQARGAYLVQQEGVTAEEKEMDIRLQAQKSQVEGVFELKVGDKPYSAADLKATITEQLVAKYLAPAARRAGILLITRAERNQWKHPETGAILDFEGLICFLQAHARMTQSTFPAEIHIDVGGLDLTPRLATERANLKKRRADKGEGSE